LQRARGSVDGDLGDHLGHIDGALGILESGRVLDKVIDLIGDQVDVRAKRLGCETELDELLSMSACILYNLCISHSSYLLLLHELRVGAIVDNMATENGGSERGVDLLGIDIAQLAIEDELVSLGA
jgi:hypothetical protein